MLVIEDVLLRAVGARPRIMRLERERVQMRGNVARRAGIGVLAPDAAEIVGFLEDGEAIEPRLLQVVRHAEPGKARADDGDGRLRADFRGGQGALRFRRSARNPAAASARKPAAPRAPRARAASARNAGLRTG